MNELLVWWYLFVENNMDVLIMTITLLVVGALVLEVIRLNKRIEKLEERADWNVEDLNNKFYHLEALLSDNITDQVNVNTHFAEDIDRIDKKVNQLKMVCDAWGIKAKKNK